MMFITITLEKILQNNAIIPCESHTWQLNGSGSILRRLDNIDIMGRWGGVCHHVC